MVFSSFGAQQALKNKKGQEFQFTGITGVWPSWPGIVIYERLFSYVICAFLALI